MFCCRDLDPGLEEPIATIIWATPRLVAEVPELKVVTDQLTAKYGKEFTQHCKSNDLNNVNEKVMHKLSVQAPPKVLVENYLVEIARTYNVAYTPDPHTAEDAEVLAAEGLLIDFNDRRNGGGAGGSGGTAMKPMMPAPSQPPPVGFAPPQQVGLVKV